MDSVLRKLERLLRGLNYSVFLGVYRVSVQVGATTNSYVKMALGTEAVVGGCHDVSRSELLSIVEESIRYEGDETAGPKPSALHSNLFESLLSDLLVELDLVLDYALSLTAFWLDKGHPYYPVYSDFAFVIAGPAEALVFIGSSSD